MRFLRTLSLSVVLSAGIYAIGCEDEDTTAPAIDPTIADVVFEAGATDEALLNLLAAAPKDEPAKAAALTTPEDGAEVPKAAPVTFEWEVGAMASNEAPSGARPATRGARFELLGPPRAAWAHGEPVDGNAYLVVFSTSSNPKLLRVFTKSTAYTPDAASWAKLGAAGGPVTARVTWAYFEDNRIAQDGGGPYAGTPSTFTVVP